MTTRESPVPKTLDKIIASLPKAERAKSEARARELVAEAKPWGFSIKQ